MTLLADINHPGSQEDIVSNWEPAHSVVEDASLWGGDCPLPSGSGWHIPASLPLAGEEPVPKSKCLLMSWVQSPSAVILEPRKIKSVTLSTVYLYIELLDLEHSKFSYTSSHINLLLPLNMPF